VTVIPVATRWPKEGKPVSTKLNQLIAIEKGAKPQANADVAAAYQRVGKADLLAGISRTYRPLDDMGEELPAESKRPNVLAAIVHARIRAHRLKKRASGASHNQAVIASPADASTSYGRSCARTGPGPRHHHWPSLKLLDNNIEIPSGRRPGGFRPRPDVR
jgi:hypothetical protein